MARSIVPNLWGDKNKETDLFSSLHREIDKVFDDFTRGGHWPFRALAAGNGKMSPLIDVSETDKGVEVTVELPGVDEKDIDVSLANDVLTIKGEKKSETEKTAKDYHLIERAYGAFERSTRLPCEVDASKVKAEFKNGSLTVTVPKPAEAIEATKKIEVK